MVLQDAIGFACTCRYFLRESSGLILALWIEVLDILRNTFPFVLPPVQPVYLLFFFTRKQNAAFGIATHLHQSSHPSIRGRTGKGIQPESRDVLKRFRTGRLHTFETSRATASAARFSRFIAVSSSLNSFASSLDKMGLIALGSASALAGTSSFLVAETALSLSPSAKPFAASHSAPSYASFLSSASVGLGGSKGPSSHPRNAL